MLVRAAETLSAEPWCEEWWKTAESATDALAHAKSVSGKSSRCAIMETYVDDCDVDAAKPLRALVWKVVRTQFAATDQYKCTYSLVLCARPGLVSWSSSQLERLHSEDLGRCCETRFWSDSCLHHCWTVRHIPPDPELLPEQPCDPGVREEVCCSCHAAHVSIFLSLSHGSQDLSHACARGPERKLGTFSV